MYSGEVVALVLIQSAVLSVVDEAAMDLFDALIFNHYITLFLFPHCELVFLVAFLIKNNGSFRYFLILTNVPNLNL